MVYLKKHGLRSTKLDLTDKHDDLTEKNCKNCWLQQPETCFHYVCVLLIHKTSNHFGFITLHIGVLHCKAPMDGFH